MRCGRVTVQPAARDGTVLAQAGRPGLSWAGPVVGCFPDAPGFDLVGDGLAQRACVRIDPADASALCQTVADQVEAWRIREAPHHRPGPG